MLFSFVIFVFFLIIRDNFQKKLGWKLVNNFSGFFLIFNARITQRADFHSSCTISLSDCSDGQLLPTFLF